MSNDKSHVSILIQQMRKERLLTRSTVTYDDINHRRQSMQSLPHMLTVQPSSLPDENLRQAARTQVSQELLPLELPRKIRKIDTEQPDSAQQNV